MREEGIPNKRKVILRLCPEYDPASIEKIIREGIAELGLEARIRVRIAIKPNVVMSHPKVTRSAFTRPEFREGLVRALRAYDPASRITVAEKCAAIPTTRMFRRAGYFRRARKLGFKLAPIDESARLTVPLGRGVVHKTIRTARALVERDILVYAPKLKTNSLSHSLTASIKLNIGILRDRQRIMSASFFPGSGGS